MSELSVPVPLAPSLTICTLAHTHTHTQTEPPPVSGRSCPFGRKYFFSGLIVGVAHGYPELSGGRLVTVALAIGVL